MTRAKRANKQRKNEDSASEDTSLNKKAHSTTQYLETRLVAALEASKQEHCDFTSK